MFFKAVSWTSFLFFFFSNNGRFLDPLRNPKGSKMAPQIDQWAPKGANNLIVQRHFRDPSFHETMVINVPLGHRGFERSLVRLRLAHLLFWLRSFALCFIQHFLSFVHKTSVNTQPLSPPFFLTNRRT